jgi:hypothetical protein
MIKKYIFVVSLFLFIVVAAYPADLRVRVIAQKATIKLEPNLQSQTISAVPLGAILRATKKEGEWYFVELPEDKGFKVSGYIHQSAVNVLAETEEEKKAKELEAKAKTEAQPQEAVKPAAVKPEVTAKEKQKEVSLSEKDKTENKSVQSPQTSNVKPGKERKRLYLRGGLGLSFPSGDWAELFGFGIEAELGNGYTILRQSMLNIDLLGSFGGSIFFRKSGYSEISWTRAIIAGDCRFTIKPAEGISIFGQGGVGLYLDILEIHTWWWYEDASKFRVGPRFGGGIGYRGLELYVIYHAVEDKMLGIGISAVF